MNSSFEMKPPDYAPPPLESPEEMLAKLKFSDDNSKDNIKFFINLEKEFNKKKQELQKKEETTQENSEKEKEEEENLIIDKNLNDEINKTVNRFFNGKDKKINKTSNVKSVKQKKSFNYASMKMF
tara:strand:- start:285 stop:659 length:375 start_codon:yes stop_codon:yes gene_type:complete